MKENSRRSFIKGVTLSGIAACGLPYILQSAEASEPKDQINKKDGTVILFQGDSITDGKRGRNNDLNHIMGHGYAFSIASRIGADYPERKYQFYNRGISGNKITDLEKRWQTDTLDLKPDVLSILVGINDSSSVVLNWEPIVSTQKFESVYLSLIEQTQKAFPDIVLVLCEPFILSVGRVKENWEAYHSDIIQRQKIVRNLAARFNTIFVGFQQVFDEACKKAPADYWIWDGVHPTVAGHELMAREWIKQMNKTMDL